MTIIITILYVVGSLLFLFGVMYLIRRQRERELNKKPTNKLTDIKEDAVKREHE